MADLQAKFASLKQLLAEKKDVIQEVRTAEEEKESADMSEIMGKVKQMKT